jgi:hypothetical protein
MQPYEVKLEVPHEVLLNLNKSPGEAAKDIRRQAAIRYYKKRVLSLGKAADLAGMSRFRPRKRNRKSLCFLDSRALCRNFPDLDY